MDGNALNVSLPFSVSTADAIASPEFVATSAFTVASVSSVGNADVVFSHATMPNTAAAASSEVR